MARRVDAARVKAWLSEPGEIAFLDVREAGQFGEGHPFFAIPVPYSVLEVRLPSLAPNRDVRVVLIDDGDGVAERAAKRCEEIGYRDVHVVEDGVKGWSRAGYTLFEGVNLPSKTFGEIVEMQRHTPRVTGDELLRRQAAGERLVIVDGRPFSEYQKMSIPGGVCCPNGELALRIDQIVRDPGISIVVNCAGRTRSIIGAETLRAIGVGNKVEALENGTQGWFLAGHALERGASRRHSLQLPGRDVLERRREAARAVALRCGVRFVNGDEVRAWLAAAGALQERTTILLDVRTPEEHRDQPVAGAVPAPGGQLIQASDQYVGVKGARLVLIDDDGVRAPVVGHWMAQLGHETFVLEGGVGAALALPVRPAVAAGGADRLASIAVGEVAAAMSAGARVIDLRASAAFREGHIAGAEWSIRPRLANCEGVKAGAGVLLAGPAEEAMLAAKDLRELGIADIRRIAGGVAEWRSHGLKVVAEEADPPDSARIDFLFFVHDRHEGNAAAARRYLEWETGLLARLDAQERGVFRVADLSH